MQTTSAWQIVLGVLSAIGQPLFFLVAAVVIIFIGTALTRYLNARTAEIDLLRITHESGLQDDEFDADAPAPILSSEPAAAGVADAGTAVAGATAVDLAGSATVPASEDPQAADTQA
ncbi:hypothetical protein [Neoactinobaculum massilliense]|uniref:hypothetical protein n=1 Tax=Neoactinobaculum massilliense TaxID=2364794 RepID=UPI000F5402F6|nr:hypothetical protein [Neoactinobaculum massilliense]